MYAFFERRAGHTKALKLIDTLTGDVENYDALDDCCQEQ